MEREALKNGLKLQQGNTTWTIESCIGGGGSSLIYRARREEGGHSENRILKEIYPSPENGIYVRDKESGQIIPADGSEREKKQGAKLLARLRNQLGREQEIGAKLRDSSFLVCNCRVLREVHLEGKTEIMPGFAEMQSLEESCESLRSYEERLSQKYKGAIPLRISLSVLSGIADTLKKIHESGFLYCDFSPSNVFLLNTNVDNADTRDDNATDAEAKNTSVKDADASDDKKTAVFLDFGSALQKFGNKAEVSADYFPSTFGYRAPELAQSSDGRLRLYEETDIFNIMTFFYELVSGERFPSLNWDYEFEKSAYIHQRLISWERAEELGAENPAVLFFLNKLLAEGLTWSVSSRIPSVDALKQQLCLLEKALSCKDDISQALFLIWEETGGRLLGWEAAELEDVHLSLEALCRAVGRLDQDMLGDYRISEASFRYTWLKFWIEQLPVQQEEDLLLKQACLSLNYCGVAVYNYLGNDAEAIKCYRSYEKHKEVMGWQKFLAVRLRAAESHANVFEFKEAAALVKKNLEILYDERHHRQEKYSLLVFQAEKEPGSLEIGRTESALARYLCFQNDLKALPHFENALHEFRDNFPNLIRTQNSMLQMAVARKNRPLFEEYRVKFLGKGTMEEQLNTLLEKPEGQNAYNLYALLKGIEAFFRPASGKDSWIDEDGTELSRDCLMKMFENLSGQEATVFHYHPWELIYRHAAILCANVAGEMTETALRLFALSVQVTPVLEDEDASIFNTVTAFHYVTKVCEAKVSWEFAGQNRKAEAEKELDCSLKKLYQYLRRFKCNLILPKEWKQAENLRKKYQLVREKFSYEYY